MTVHFVMCHPSIYDYGIRVVRKPDGYSFTLWRLSDSADLVTERGFSSEARARIRARYLRAQYVAVAQSLN